MNRHAPIVATFSDHRGEPQTVVRRRRGVLAVVRPSGPTPLQALNSAVQAIVQRKLKALRIDRGWSLKDTSERMGHVPPDKQRMWAIENNITDGFSVGTIYAAALTFDVPISFLIPSAEEVKNLARVEFRGDALKIKAKEEPGQ